MKYIGLFHKGVKYVKHELLFRNNYVNFNWSTKLGDNGYFRFFTMPQSLEQKACLK